MDDLVGTPDQVAARLHTTDKAIRALRDAGRGFPVVYITRTRWVVPWAALEKWLSDQAAATTPRPLTDET